MKQMDSENSMNKTRVLFTLAVLFMLPLTAFAQDAQEQIDHARARALEAGIPVSLLDSKVAEGRAKGVDMDRIATAVELRLTNLERAKASMSRGANDADAAQLSVGADAIGAGVGEAILEKVAAAASRDRRAVAIAALTQLVLHGVAPDAALVRVQEAIARGPQALANLASESNTPTRSTGRSNPHPPITSPGATHAKPPIVPTGSRGVGRGGK